MQAPLIDQTAGQTTQLQLSSLGTSKVRGRNKEGKKMQEKKCSFSRNNAVLMDHGISDTQQEDDLFSSTEITMH